MLLNFWINYFQFAWRILVTKNPKPLWEIPVDTRCRFNANATSYRRWNDVACLLGYLPNFCHIWQCALATSYGFFRTSAYKRRLCQKKNRSGHSEVFCKKAFLKDILQISQNVFRRFRKRQMALIGLQPDFIYPYTPWIQNVN